MERRVETETPRGKGARVSTEQRRSEDFAAEAERVRRAGDPLAALDLARKGLDESPGHVAGRVAAGLALLDLGRVAEARVELEAIVRRPEPGVRFATDASAAPVAPLSDLAEAELDDAFERATPEADSMMDAEGIAFQAVTAVENEATHRGPELPADAFRTQTMAELLERQGDVAGAEAIREALRDAPSEATAADPEAPREESPHKRRRLGTLERWLGNLQRGQG